VTPIVTKEAVQSIVSDSKASIDLNRSVHLVNDPPPTLLNMEVPSFDLNLDLTPEKDSSNKGIVIHILTST
jgi:hypothetical protein